jgi:hypothetical protein
MAQQEVDLTTLQTLPTKQVLQLWEAMVGSPPRCATSREFLVAMVAWQWQARACGGLTHWTQQRLARSGASTSQPPSSSSLPIGTVLVKTYQGQSYTVTVQAEGFAFEGTVYASLSEIARRITGTRWNGPAFFGLRRPSSQPHKKALSE